MTTSPNSASVPTVALPQSWSRWGLTEEQYVDVMRHSLPVLARVGTSVDQRIVRDIAAVAHTTASAKIFADTQELYTEGLRFAFAQLWPSQSADELEDVQDLIPADALRAFVVATYRRFQAHPDALRLIISENLFSTANIASRVGVLESSPVVLQVDRLLMRGHDVGAFRDGISAEDLYILMMSVAAFPVASGSTFHSLYGMNATDEVNTVGMEALVADAVLAFLTTNMPTSQGSSYTHSSLSAGMGPSVAARLYSMEALPSTVSRGLSASFADDANRPATGDDRSDSGADLYDNE